MGFLSRLFKKKEYSVEQENLAPEVSTEVEQPKFVKDSRGIISESTAIGISYGGDSVDKIFNLNGLTNDKLWECYWKNNWVRACIDKIIKEVCKYTIRVQAKTNVENKDDKKLKEKIDEVQRLFDNPNPKVESFNSLRRKYLRDILIYDAGALEIVKKSSTTKSLKLAIAEKQKLLKVALVKLNASQEDEKLKDEVKQLDFQLKTFSARLKAKEEEIKKKGDKPIELYDISGCDIKLNIDKHGNFNEDVAYQLIYSGKSIADFAIDELIYFIANPVAGSAYGVSPLESIYNTVLADNEASALNRRRLESDGMLSGVLSFPGMSPKKLKRNMMFWKQQARKKGAKFVVTSNPDVKFTKLTESPEEMQFMEYQKWILNKIMSVYGMQPLVLGVIDETTGKLNSAEQRRQFKSDAIIPLLKLESHHLTDVLIRQGFGYEDIEVSYIEPKQEITLQEISKILQEIGTLGIITINEAREMLDKSPLTEGGDRLLLPQQLQQLRDDIEREGKKMNLEKIKEKIDEMLGDIAESEAQPQLPSEQEQQNAAEKN